jgi:hypothetical protein
MYINPNRFITLQPLLDDKVFKKVGILKFKRIIYVIDENVQNVDPNNMFSCNSKRTLVLINLSKSKLVSATGFNKYIKSVYVFHCYRNILEEDNFNESTFYLDRMLTTGYEKGDETIFNTRLDLGITMGDGFNTICPTSININDLCCDGIEMDEKESLDLMDPRFYIPRHQEEILGEEFLTLPALNKFSWKGRELIDINTEIFSVVNKSKYNYSLMETGNNSLLPMSGDLQLQTLEHQMYVEDIPIRLFLISQMSFLSSFQLHWDSKYKGFNMVDVYKPKDFLLKEKLQEDVLLLEHITNKLGKKLQKVFGNLRIMYYFSPVEERVTVIFDNDKIKEMSIRFDKDNIFERAAVVSNQEYCIKLLEEYYDYRYDYTSCYSY